MDPHHDPLTEAPPTQAPNATMDAPLEPVSEVSSTQPPSVKMDPPQGPVAEVPPTQPPSATVRTPKELLHYEDWLELGLAAARLGVPPGLPSPLSLDTLQRNIEVGDPLADAALQDLCNQRGGSLPADPLAELVRRMGTSTGAAFPKSASLKADSESEAAPGRLSAAQQLFWDQVNSRPEWIDEEKIKLGQLTYWQHMTAIQSALIFSSLAGGFGVPRVNQVLISTGFLATPKKAYRRLLESVQLVLDVFTPGEGFLVGSRSWKTVVRVRLLHASVRMRQARAKVAGKCPAAAELAVNQTDMFFTILAFQLLAVTGIARVGIILSPEELDAYTHLWRVVAYYSGVADPINPCQFGFDATFPLLRDYARLYFHPDAAGATLTKALLDGISQHATPRMPAGYTVAVARAFIPTRLADVLEVPQVSPVWKFLVRLFFLVIRMIDALAYLSGSLGAMFTASRHNFLAQFMTAHVGRATFSVSPSMRRKVE